MSRLADECIKRARPCPAMDMKERIMGLEYRDMDAGIRANMVQEVTFDLDNGSIYKSPRLNDEGIRLWPDTLKEAAGTLRCLVSKSNQRAQASQKPRKSR